MTTVKAESVTCKCGCAARVHVSAVDMQARVRGAAGRSSYVGLLRCCSSLVRGLIIGFVIARGAAGRSSQVSYVALLRCCSCRVPLTHSI